MPSGASRSEPSYPGGPGPDAPPPAGGISYRWGLLSTVTLLVLLTGAALIGVMYRGARQASIELARALLGEATEHAVTRTRAYLRQAVPVVESLEQLASHGLALDDPPQLARQLLGVLEANAGLTWISYSDRTGRFTGVYRSGDGRLRVNISRIINGRTHLIEYDVLESGQWQVFREVTDSGYDPRTRPFYQRAAEAGRLVWLPPYVFYDQGGPGITCANPVHGPDGQLLGVLTADFELAALSGFVASVHATPASQLMIYDADGVLLAHPDRRVMRLAGAAAATAPASTLPMVAAADPLTVTFLHRLGDPPRGGDLRLVEFHHDGRAYFGAGKAFQVDAGLVWNAAVLAPQEDFLAAADESRQTAIKLALVALGVAVLLASWLARWVSRPIVALVALMRRVGGGELEQTPKLGGGAEFRQLSVELTRMIVDLRDRIRLLTSLSMAKEVQRRLLPPAAPQVPGLQIAGHSSYSDETGGDYYDYLPLQDVGPPRVLIAVGDVMGHGVPAALLMAGARAILHSRVSDAGGLAALLSHINDLLVPDLQGGHFMTLYLGVVNPRAATLRWASAGHESAILYDPDEGQCRELEGADVPLGVEADAEFHEFFHTPLKPGQVIVVGTDGVWDTTNPDDEFYGRARLMELIRANAALPADAICEAVRADLDAFRGDQRQTDDVTFVVVKVLATGS